MRANSLTNLGVALDYNIASEYDRVLVVAGLAEEIEALAPHANEIATLVANLPDVLTVQEASELVNNLTVKVTTLPAGSTATSELVGTEIRLGIPAGTQGAQGIQGPKGDKGDRGDIGLTGAKGPAGATGPQGPKGFRGEDGLDGEGVVITSILNNINKSLTINFSDGTQHTTDPLKGEDGRSVTITNVVNNANGTMLIKFSDGTSHHTADLRGPQGPKGNTGNHVHHIKGTSTTDDKGDFGASGEIDTYTVYGDASETINLGFFIVRNGYDAYNYAIASGYLGTKTDFFLELANLRAYSEQSQLNANAAALSASQVVITAGQATTAASASSSSASSASASASTSTTKASEALSSANNASNSASIATTKAAEALSSASTASTAASSATVSAATASTKASEASASVTASASNASAALTSKNAAAASEASALTYKNSAGTSATTATTKASAASASAAAALVSETNANTSKNTAATSATTATTKASEASTSASAASVSASTSATKATEAATSASTALGYKNDVSAMKLAIETIYDTFDDRFLGTKTTNPLVDNDGNTLLDGAMYFDTTTNAMKVYDAGTTTWYAMPQIYLNSLLDVELTSLTTDNILVWNGTKWINYTLSKADVGLNLADNTADSAKNVLSATKLTTARTINGIAFDGSANITIATTDSTKLPLSGGVMTGAITSIRETRVAVDSNSINLAAGNVFTKTISANVPLVVANIASSGTTNSFILELTNGGAYIVTWWSGVKWTGGIAPILSVVGTDILGFYSHDGGLSWHGIVVSKDSK